MTKIFILFILFFLSLINPVAGIISITTIPENPVVGDKITIQGTGAQSNPLSLSITFGQNVNVVDGKYKYELKNINIPEWDNTFVVTASNVINLTVSAKKLIWFSLPTKIAIDGTATVSQSSVPPFNYDIIIEGYAAQGASLVPLTIKASSKITADAQGNFITTYSTSGIPPGVFTLDIGGTQKTITLSPPGTAPTPTPSSNSGSGGGGGGAGISAENPNNIEIREKYALMIYKDKITSYRFKNESSPTLYVNITGNVTANDVNTVVETLKNTSSLVKFPPPGAVYKNINVWIGTGGFAGPRNIKEGIISFRVKNIWIDENNLARSDVNMLMWNGGEWLMLETVNTSTDGTYTYYESKTNTFSVFVISGLKNDPDETEKPMISTPKPTITSNQTLQTPAPTQNEVPGFEILPAIIALIVLRRRL